MTPERDLVTDILLALGSRADAHVWRQNVLVGRRGARVVRSGPNGTADILGVVSGIPLAVECKSARGRLSPAQRSWGDAFTRAGGLYVVARELADVTAALALRGVR